MLKRVKRWVCGFLVAGCLGAPAGARAQEAGGSEIVVSVKQQKMVVMEKGQTVVTYPVSTSKFGTGDAHGSYATPLGSLRVQEKIGGGAPLGAVFKSRQLTGEVLPPNAKGRDPIVTRILWLEGTEEKNRNSFERCIYIHGTPQEEKLGKPASYGCIRMKSADVIDLFERVEVKTPVRITEGNLPGTPHTSNPLMVLASLFSGAK